MTSRGDSSVSYLCPQCQAPLQAEPQDAGKRQPCPNCGKQVKVPGTANATHGKTAARPAVPSPPVTHQGIANIAVICPLCATRLHATRAQVGSTIVCPDCLESVPVPREAADRRSHHAAKTTASPPPAAVLPAGASTSETADENDDDELKLSDPIKVPAETYLPAELSELINQHTLDMDAMEPSAGQPVHDSPPDPEPDSGEFAVPCPVCDTRILATEAEIGKEIACPDCYSKVEIVRPKPRPLQTGTVVEADYEGESFALSEPVPLDVYRRSVDEITPKTLGEEALDRAERELGEHEREEAHLPESPLWTGLFKFLPDPNVLFRLSFTVALAVIIVKLTFATIGWANEGGAVWFLALIGSVGLVALSVFSTIFLGSTCLTIIQEAANGHDKVTEWPDLNFMDWAIESLAVLMAIFYCIAPGMVFGWLISLMGVPAAATWIFMALGVYAFFPFVQLSILESSSLGTPLSSPILEAMRRESLLWITFYLITAGIALAIAITVTVVDREMPLIGLIPIGALWAFTLFVYYRLLGRLAWACQVRPMLKEDRKKKDD